MFKFLKRHITFLMHLVLYFFYKIGFIIIKILFSLRILKLNSNNLFYYQLATNKTFLDIYLFRRFLFRHLKEVFIPFSHNNDLLMKTKNIVFSNEYHLSPDVYKIFGHKIYIQINYFYESSPNTNNNDICYIESVFQIYNSSGTKFLNDEPHYVFYVSKYVNGEAVYKTMDVILGEYDEKLEQNYVKENGFGGISIDYPFGIDSINILNVDFVKLTRRHSDTREISGICYNYLIHNGNGASILTINRKVNFDVIKHRFYINGVDITSEVSEWMKKNNAEIDNFGLFKNDKDKIAFVMKFGGNDDEI